MTVLVASDLDRTLIYSKGALALSDPGATRLVCVEHHEGKPASFMTDHAQQILSQLQGESVFVPVTTRVPDQYRRVQFPAGAPPYAVVANGGILLVNGVRDHDWSRQVRHRLADSVPLADVWEHVSQVCRPEWTVKIRNAAGLFCYAVVHRSKLPDGFVAELTGWAADRGWTTSMQGRKLYWVPRRLTKSAAVEEVARRAGTSTIVAAGDSLLDIDLLEAADQAIHPAHGEIAESGWTAPHVDTTDAAGVLAGEQIVEWFAARS